MTTVKDAGVALVGTILNLENTTNFETKVVDGLKVMVGASDGSGFAVVKLSLLEAEQIKPVLMRPFAGVVRFGAWGGKGGQGEVTCRYVGPIDLDLFASTVNAARQKAA